jgi:acetoin utilization protein AcuB
MAGKSAAAHSRACESPPRILRPAPARGLRMQRAEERRMHMRIQNWMKHPAITVKPMDSARHAREMMERHRVNQLPVVTGGDLVGIVSDRDLRDAFPSVFESAEAAAKHRRAGTDPAMIPVEDVMTRDVLTLEPSLFVVDAARVMRRERIGAIPIVDGTRLVGIITRSDVLDAFVELAQNQALAG